MIEAEQFAIGLSRIALAVRESVDAATFAVYHELVAERTDAEEWQAFTVEFARHPPRGHEGRPRFPTVVELLDALAEFRGAPPLEREATEAYDRVLAASTYTPEGGATWNYRDVRERCGLAAAEAFLEAGGHHAFATTWDESRRRGRFLAAYQAEARERPGARLLPEGGRLLPAGADAGDPPKAEAERLLGEIAKQIPGVG